MVALARVQMPREKMSLQGPKRMEMKEEHTWSAVSPYYFSMMSKKLGLNVPWIADHTQEGVEQNENVNSQHSNLPAAESAFIPAPLLGSGRFLSHNLPVFIAEQ